MGPPPAHSDVPGLLVGRACRICVQIKVKCVPLEGANICQRCHRLNKTCTTPAPASKRPTSRTKEPHSRHSTQIAPSNYSALPTPPHVHAATSSKPGEASTILEEYPLLGQGGTKNPIVPTARFKVEVSSGQQEKLFNEFRIDMTRFFPYIVIPSDETTDAFRSAHPALFRACLAAASHRDPALQKALTEDTYRVVAERMLFEGAKGLDLLQALLVLIAWYHIYTVHNPQLMNLVHLAMAMVVDLGLNRPPAPFQTRLSTDTDQIIYGKAVNAGLQTNDDRRAVLGCYYLSSKLSSCMRRFDGMRFSAHLADCCKSLEAAKEYPSDLAVVYSIKLRTIEDRYTRTDAMGNLVKLPSKMILNCFQEDLRNYREALPPTLTKDPMFGTGIKAAETIVYDTIINAEEDSPLDRVEALFAALLHVEEFIMAMASTPPQYMPNISFTAWMHVIHALTVLAKLSFLVTEGWDLEIARRTVNFVDMVDRITSKLENARAHEISRFGGENGGYVRFAMYEEKMRQCKKWYELKVEAETHNKNISEQQSQFAPSTMPLNSDLSEPLFYGLDDDLWQSFLGSWDPAFYNMPMGAEI